MVTKVVILASLLLVVGCGQQATTGSDISFDVVLQSITVTPDTASIEIGTTAPFTATGIYSNGSTGAIPVTWGTSDHLIATVDGVGVVTALLAGAVQLTATSVDHPAITGYAIVTVTALPPPPPDITTTFLADGTVGRSYTETLRYDFGSGIPVWSIIVGALPPGLTLNATTGDITGTPTNPGGPGAQTYYFTVQVVAGGVDTQSLSIRISLISTS